PIREDIRHTVQSPVNFHKQKRLVQASRQDRRVIKAFKCIGSAHKLPSSREYFFLRQFKIPLIRIEIGRQGFGLSDVGVDLKNRHCYYSSKSKYAGRSLSRLNPRPTRPSANAASNSPRMRSCSANAA